MTTVVMAERSDDELHDAIGSRLRDLCTAHAALLADIGEHDRVEAWRRYGARSEEDYLVRHHEFLWSRARDAVREARVLARHPELAEAYAAATMSPDKLSAACRLVANADAEADQPVGPFDPVPDSSPSPEPSPAPDPAPEPSSPHPEPDPSPPPGSTPATMTPEQFLAYIEEMSAKQLSHVASREQRASAAAAAALYRRRHLKALRVEDERRLTITVAELFDDDAALVWAALNDYAANTKPDPETGAYDPMPMRYADALVAMATAYLAAREKVTNHPMVFFHADARVLAGEEGWAETSDFSPLAAETIRRLACMSRIGLVADDPEGNPLNLGRTARTATWQQIEMCLRRDGGCRLCGSLMFLQAHHIQFWGRDGGPTDLANLMAGCSGCHHKLHEGGWRIEGDPNGELRFISPTGVVIRTYPHPPPRSHKRRRSAPPPEPTRPECGYAADDGARPPRSSAPDAAQPECTSIAPDAAHAECRCTAPDAALSEPACGHDDAPQPPATLW